MTPEGLKNILRYDPDKGPKEPHKRLLKSLEERLRMSERRMRSRWDQIDRNEEIFQAYIPESENDALRRRDRESGAPQYTTIEIPYSYAVLMTAHTYYSSVFLSRNPVFQMAGRHGEAEMQVQAVEAVMDYQRMVGEMMVPLFVWLLDPGKAGFGVIGHYWDEQFVTCRKVEERPGTWLGMELPGLKPIKEEIVSKHPSYRGNKIYNVRPQDWFPDPRVPMKYFQRGEFVGRYVENSWFDIVAGEKAGKYFNIEALRKLRQSRDRADSAQTVVQRSRGSLVSNLPDESTSDFGQRVPPGFVKSFELYVKLSPKEWNLGKEDDPEIWVFTLSANGIIYGVEPLGEYHGQFPFDIIEDEVDGYSLFSRSILERSQPMADIISWLVNTHFYNVRQTMYNQFVVDPMMVVMKDLEDPNPGKLIRLKPEAYGKDVRTALTQLTTQDVTRSHIGDIQFVADFIQRVTGINDSTMGVLPQKSHTTATAVRTSSSFAVNRMKTNCEYYSAMGWTPLAMKLLQRTQQHMDFEQKMRVVGDLAQFGQEFVQVDPALITGFYDFVPVDGTMPVDRFAQANLWQMILGQVQRMPQIMASYDMGKIFAWVATLAGIKNIAQFRLTPDQAVLQQAQAGNVIPLRNAPMPGGGGSPPTPRANPNEPRQVPMMGATG